MAKGIISTLSALIVLCGPGQIRAQVKPEIIERGKKATALVELSNASRWTGTAFCVDKSGLFLTGAHVVQKATRESSTINLVLDIGQDTQRSLRARLLRYDDEANLALLQVASRPTPAEIKKDATAVLRSLAKPKEDLVFTPLELGNDASLIELADVTTFGYPFPQAPIAGRAVFPAVTVLSNHISSLRKDQGRLVGIQIDSQLNPGSAGGPVLDASGKVIGLVMATVQGAAMNLAIPVGRLAEFLAAPGIVFYPPPLTSDDRTRPVTWTILMAPPVPRAKIPEGLSVSVTLKPGTDQPRTFTAEPAGPGTFKLTCDPLPKDPPRGVELMARFGTRGPTVRVTGEDSKITVGGKPFNLSAFRAIFPSGTIRAETVDGKTITGQIEGLGKAQRSVGQRAVTYDLHEARQITVRSFNMAPADLEVQVEARQGTKVVATIRKPIKIQDKPAIASRASARPSTVAPRRTVMPAPLVPANPAADDGPVKLGGKLNIKGEPRGAGETIKPPSAAIPAAQLTPSSQQRAEPPLARQLEGKMSDVVAGGGGRYLLLTLSDASKLAVFDVNSAEVVKTISLTADNALVAAGASKFLIAYPNEKRIERWDLSTLSRDGDSHPVPFDRPLRGIVMGSDSEGPALAFWNTGEPGPGLNVYRARFSFIDIETFLLLRISSVAHGKFNTVGERDRLSASKGSFMVDQFLGHGKDDQVSLRASAGGGVFGIWQQDARFQTVVARGGALSVTFNKDFVGHLTPGADGQSVFTGLGRRRYIDEPIGNEVPGYTAKVPDPAIPSSDPSYYLTIAGLPREVAGTTSVYDAGVQAARPEAVTLQIHAAGDGSPLLTVHGLDEMSVIARVRDWRSGGLATDKRFLFIPAAHLLITIPPSNDRLLLRRLEIDKALEKAGADEPFVTTPLSLSVTAGDQLDHQIVARSRKGGIKYSLTSGPDGLTLTPDGKLKWLVPASLKGQEVEAVVTVTDATGQERFRKITIRVN